MAVENKYVDSNLEAGDRAEAKLHGGAHLRILHSVFAPAAADSDGSIYRLGRIHSSSILPKIEFDTAGVTGGTDWDLGFYDVSGPAGDGAVVEKDILYDGKDMSSAGNGNDGLGSVAVADRAKPVWELIGLSSDPGKFYDIAWTANTVGSGTQAIRTTVFELKQG